MTVLLATLLAQPALADVDAAGGLVDASGRYDHDLTRRHVVHVAPAGASTRLARVFHERVVDASPEEAWALLSDYGNVHAYAPVVTASGLLGDSPESGLHCDRSCSLDFQGRQVEIKERVFAWDEGSSFTYDVYEAQNFPLKKMHVTFGVRQDALGRTVVYNIIDYRLKPGIMTGFMRRTMRRSAVTSVLSFKHYLETGEPASDAGILVDRYGAASDVGA